MNKISAFNGEYRWLSNFYSHAIVYEGITYLSTEAAYQAAKSLDIRVREHFKTLSPRDAKELGRKIKVRHDWEDCKESVMYDILKLKFQDRVLRKDLANTYPAELIEGNWWHDCEFGHCTCMDCFGREKKNILGKLLMQIRDEVIAEDSVNTHIQRN